MTFAYLLVFFLIVGKIEGKKMCNVMKNTISREVWKPFTGFYCYNYTNIDRLNTPRYDMTPVVYKNTLVPGTDFHNGTYFWYDFENATSLSLIRPSFRTEEFFELWKSCCREAVACCDDFMNDENIYPTEEYPCPAIWDSWSCFAPAKAGTIEKLPCSRQAYSTQSEICELKSEKECFANGTWNQKTNYAVCAIAPLLRRRHSFNVIVLAVAAAVSFPAIIIFFSFRSLRSKTRFILHRNLILIIIIRNILSIMTKEIVILDSLKSSDSNHVKDYNGVGCRILAFFENVAKNGMFASMLIDGFYLHKLIVRAFANEPNIMYLHGAVLTLSLVPSLIWALLRGLHHGEDCWVVDDSQDQWVPDGFRIAILAINCLLLLDIIRVMVMKLRRGSTSQQAKTTLRATLFLIPLFGIHIIVISNRNIVVSNTCAAEDVYLYISYLLEGLQGIMVSVLFCYINSEVHGEIKNAYRKFTLYLDQNFHFGINKLKPDRRRTTAATYVENSQK